MPETFKAFVEFIESFRITPQTDSSRYVRQTISQGAWTSLDDGRLITASDIWYVPDDKLSIDSFRKKLLLWMGTRGLPNSEDAVGLMIIVIALLAEEKVKVVDAMKEIEECIKEAGVLQFHILAPPDDDQPVGSFAWAGFRLECLNASKLVYYCRKAQAIHLQAMASQRDGFLTLHSPPRRRKIVDLSDLFWRRRTPLINRYGPNLLQCLFQCIANEFADVMWDELEDSLVLPFSITGNLLPLNKLRYYLGSENWTCLSKLGENSRRSWVGITKWQPVIRMPKLDPSQRNLDKANARFKFDEIKNSSMAPLIRAVSSSLVRSTTHFSESRIDEAFLFRIIAIEQVVSSKDNTTKAIASRTALIARPKLQLEWTLAIKHVSKIYDLRSRLVHDGKSVKQEDLLLAADLAHSILLCLMRLALKAESKIAGFHQQWLKSLDYLCAGYDAGKPPSDADLIENGIIDSPAL